MKISIDKELCVGCELCVNTCPEVFEKLEGQEVVQVKEELAGVVPNAAIGAVSEAADDCPTIAIIIEE